MSLPADIPTSGMDIRYRYLHMLSSRSRLLTTLTSQRQWTRKITNKSFPNPGPSSSIENVKDVISKIFTNEPKTDDSFLTSFASAEQTSLIPKRKPPNQSLMIPLESDPTLHLLTSLIMRHGNRHSASSIVSQTLLHIHSMTHSPPLPILRSAISLASPSVRMRSQKTGGKVLLKPEALNEKQRTRVGINNLLKASFGKSGRSLGERLARECVAVVAGGDSER